MATKHSFQTEITQLLDLMIHSLYSNKEIFLRELVSNASDALDKLSYLTLSDEKFKSLAFSPRIDISFDDKKGTITIQDNGIGMNESDLKEHLGVIAKSGTKSFLSQLSGDKKKDSALIGQFGVGFYSAFMVADRVVVQSKKAGEDKAYAWVSDGKGEYEIGECVQEDFGTQITLYLKNDEKHFASRWEIESIIGKYSEHIAFPIYLHYSEVVSEPQEDNAEDKKEGTEDKSKKKEKLEQKQKQINSAKALWTLPKSELKEQDYKDFYKSFAHDNADPLRWIHTKVEGNLEYTTLFFIPKSAPFDLYRVDYQSGVKLYVKRVFITDDDKELLPSYLRFVRGVIDSSDLPLNVSREILQQNKILANIKSASTKKILSEIASMAKDENLYKEFFAQFGKVLKEGLYGDYENKEKLLELMRFDSQNREFISLKSYKESMPKEQKSIYYVLGERKELLKNSPLLEKFANKGFEVLLLSDEIDGMVMPMVGEYDKTPLKNISSKDALDEIGDEGVSEEVKKEFEPIVAGFKDTLGEQIGEVSLTSLMQQAPKAKPNIEINVNHEIFQKLKNSQDKDKIAKVAQLLFGSALIAEGGSPEQGGEFSKQLNALMIEWLNQ